MYPPFYVVDPRIDYDVSPVEERRIIRRGQPEPRGFHPLPPDTPVIVTGRVVLLPEREPGPVVRALRALSAGLRRRDPPAADLP